MRAQHYVLLVDDSPEIRDPWSRLLALAGFMVKQAADGAEAVRVARETQPDAIVMDVMMPVLDGITALRQLKADRRTAAIPVILVSGDVSVGAAARAAGCDAFLVKPVLMRDIVKALARLLPQPLGRR